MSDYVFNPKEAFEVIEKDILEFSKKINSNKVVIGISGGKDSTVVAFTAAKIFGKDNVYGVMMPNGLQKDINDSMEVIKLTGINSYAIDIKNSFDALIDQLSYNGIKIHQDTKVNTPPRLRMTTLYAIAQSIGGFVINTDNLCERALGYSTLWGDSVGSYGMIQDLTVREVIELGKWLGAPDYLVEKKPGDGLQELGDEDRLGITYQAVHDAIRLNKYQMNDYATLMKHYGKNKFKMEMIHLPGPRFGYPNHVFGDQMS